MINNLPLFKYHPNAINTVFSETKRPCDCCGQNIGISYDLPIYTSKELSDDISICPFCIENGKAAKYTAGVFNTFYEDQCGVKFDKVRNKTPSYSTWQDKDWIVHCNEPTIFLGNPSKEIIESNYNSKSEMALDYELSKEDLSFFVDSYLNGGTCEFYYHKCQKCERIIFSMDFS